MLRQTSLTARSLQAEQVALEQRSETEKRNADRPRRSLRCRPGQLVGLMASGSTELEATAKSMSGTAASTTAGNAQELPR